MSNVNDKRKNARVIIDNFDSTIPLGLWHKTANVSVRGYSSFKDGVILDSKGLSNHFDSESKEVFRNKLEESDGCFAVIVQTRDYVFAAVDRINSIPLYYGFDQDENLIISDRAESIRKRIEDIQINPQAEQEFLSMGLVIGRGTLLPNVFRLQAGEYFFYNCNSKEIVVEKYYGLDNNDKFDYGEAVLFTKLDHIYESYFSQLIKWLNGREVILPLSGGYDSRLVAFMLKELGYENVHCFAYNYARRDWEIDISKKVAERLGYKWSFIACTPALYKKYLQKKMKSKLIVDIVNWSSWPVIQEWPPLFKLYEETDSKESVLLSGHGGFLAGGHVPKELFTKKEINKKDLLKIFQSYFCTDLSGYNNCQIRVFNEFMINGIEGDKALTSIAIRNWRIFQYEERSSKIVGRGFTLAPIALGIQFVMPLLNKNAIMFWNNISTKHLQDKSLFTNYVKQRHNYMPLGNPRKAKMSKSAKIKDMVQIFKLQLSRFTLPEKIYLLIIAKFNIKKYYQIIVYKGYRLLAIRKLKQWLRT